MPPVAPYAETPEQRVAMLLHALGATASQTALERLDESKAAAVRRELDELRRTPPSQEEVDAALEDFERLFRFALETEATALKLHQTLEAEAEMRQEDRNEPFTPSDDPVEDLNRLEEFQLVGALQDENPRTVAIVTAQLSPERAAEVMRRLPTELRMQAVSLMVQKQKTARPLLERIARTIIGKGLVVDRKEMEQPSTEQRLADMLRAMSKSARMETLQVLEEQDAEQAERIKEMLYVFSDILRFTDRSVQKLLSEVDTTTLTTALSGADPAIVDRIMNNLSKRVRESLKEEMQFRGPVAEDLVNEARKSLGATMAQMDQAGELMLQT